MTPVWKPVTLAAPHQPTCAAAGLALMLIASGPGHAQDTTIPTASGTAQGQTTMTTTRVHNGNNRASISQSGGAGPVTKRVETRPGYTRIEQKSGGNHSVVVQSSDPADLRGLPQLQHFPKELRDLLGLPDPSKP